MDITTCFNVGGQIVHEALDDEVVILDLFTGTYYILTQTAADIWALASQGASVGQVVETLGARYTSTREALTDGIDQFIGQLIEEKLVLPVPNGQEATITPLPPLATRFLFALPALQKYTDLQALLYAYAMPMT